MGFAFIQTQQKYEKDKKKTNINGESNSFHFVNQDNWAEDFTGLEEEQKLQLCTNVGTTKYDVDREGYTT